MSTSTRKPMTAALAVLVLVLLSGPVAAATLLGGDQMGNLISINTNNGVGVLIGTELNFPLSTEIEFDVNTGTLYSEEANGALGLHTINPATGLSTGFVVHGCCALNGLEFVGNTLYATNVMAGGGTPSTLETINPGTGVLTPIGPTGQLNISGLAYETSTNTMYGVTAGAAAAGGPAQLVTVNLGSGLATPIAPLVDVATGLQLDRVGSIEFASDGVLYGGMGLNAVVNPGWLFSINPATGASTFIGPTGFPGITGLTNPIPEPTSLGLLALGLAVLCARRRRRR